MTILKPELNHYRQGVCKPRIARYFTACIFGMSMTIAYGDSMSSKINKDNCRDAFNGNQMAQLFVSKGGVDCTIYGYPSSVNENSEKTRKQWDSMDFQSLIDGK